MEAKYLKVFTVILAISLALTSAGCMAISQEDNDSSETRQIAVSGSGQVDVDPDKLVVTLGVEVIEDTASQARTSNAEKTEKVVNALKEIGLSEDQIETERYSLYPEKEYNREKGTSSVVGYRAVNTLKVTTNETDKAGEIIDTAVNNGANNVERVTFTLQQQTREQAREQAIKKAIKDAETEALTAANEIGVQLGQPSRISLRQTSFQPYSPNLRLEAAATPTPTPAPTPSPSTPIQPGDVTVTANVDITYDFH